MKHIVRGSKNQNNRKLLTYFIARLPKQMSKVSICLYMFSSRIGCTILVGRKGVTKKITLCTLLIMLTILNVVNLYVYHVLCSHTLNLSWNVALLCMCTYSPVHLFQNTLRPQKNCNRIVLNGFVFSNYLKTTYTKSAKIESAIAA